MPVAQVFAYLVPRPLVEERDNTQFVASILARLIVTLRLRRAILWDLSTDPAYPG